MASMFEGCKAFNTPLNNWNVSKVTNMEKMFKGCTEFNQDINNWDVSNVTNMKSMFEDCADFNNSLGKWNVSKVINMEKMFKYCWNFNQDLSNWDVSNVTIMDNMFLGCKIKKDFKFIKNPKETIIVDKKEKCIICLEELDVYNKLCNKDIRNDHYYCDDCLEKSNTTKCLICKTPKYHIKYQMKSE